MYWQAVAVEVLTTSPSRPRPSFGAGASSSAIAVTANVGWTVTGVDPGQVYAQLILSGDRLGPYVVPAQAGQSEPWVSATAYGAGRLRLPQAGLSRSGKAWVSANLQYLEVPIDVPDNGIVRVDAAIWWPGESGATQNNLDLVIKAPGGLQTGSYDPHGVFERARVQRASGLKGTVRLRVYPTSVGAGPQVVYWAASLSRGLVP